MQQIGDHLQDSVSRELSHLSKESFCVTGPCTRPLSCYLGGSGLRRRVEVYHEGLGDKETLDGL